VLHKHETLGFGLHFNTDEELGVGAQLHHYVDTIVEASPAEGQVYPGDALVKVRFFFSEGNLHPRMPLSFKPLPLDALACV
jgi:hypothetical protein